MAGFDWDTGQVLDGWPHVVMSIRTLFTTEIGSRVMLRTYGGNISRLLGAPMTPATLLRFRAGLTAALELWEPRFRVHMAMIKPADNSPETMRQGQLRGILFDGEYRPRGHLGDPTPEADFRRIFVGIGQSSFQVSG
jgi:phage baseplate assembly protein W